MYQAVDGAKTMNFALCTTIGATSNGASAACGGEYFAQLSEGSACTPYSTTSNDSFTDSTYTGMAITNLSQIYTGPAPAAPAKAVTFNVGLLCDASIDIDASEIGDLVLVAGSTTDYQTTLKGDLACDVYSLNAFFEFVNEYNWLFAIILMVIGIPFCFGGRKLFSCIVFVVGILITVSVIMLIFYSTFLKSDTEYWVGWVVLSCSILAGLAVGFVLFKCQKLGAAAIAGWGGFLGGLIINTTFLFTAS